MAMFLKRVATALRTQNWTAIGIELVIVVVGVFIGTQVSNWNQQRIEKQQAEVLLDHLRPELHGFIDFFDTAKPYYAVTRSYARTALAGWARDPAVTDEQFVIAAYQATQIYGFGVNGQSWTLIFGGDQLRNIDDPQIRRQLSYLMTIDYGIVDIPAVDTPYRRNIRSVIPEDVQEAIVQACGDRPLPNRPLQLFLPGTCDLDLPPERFRAAAADLRARPQLIEDLRWHLALTASFLSNMAPIETETRSLLVRIEARH
jgi:hypothetical protein